MKIKIPGTKLVITTRSVLAAAEAAAGHVLEDAVTAAKKTEIGIAATSIVKALEDSKLSGSERMAHAIGEIVPFILGYIGKGGFSALAADVATFARQLLESVLADIRNTSTAAIAASVLEVAKAG